MTRNEINIGIEKHRTKLLRIVLCWLVFAQMFKSKSNRVLPSRFGAWVCDQIFKAEKAAYYLRLVAGVLAPQETMPIFQPRQMTIGEVILRLKALKKTLVQLKRCAKRLSSSKRRSQRQCAKNHTIKPNIFALCATLSIAHAAASRAPPKAIHIYTETTIKTAKLCKSPQNQSAIT